MPLAGVNDEHAVGACRREHLAARFNRGLQAGYIIAERFAEPAGFEKIALHVDNDQRGATEIHGKRRRLSLKSDSQHLALAISDHMICRIGCKIGASGANGCFPFVFRDDRSARELKTPN
jgi:hypothetical protein